VNARISGLAIALLVASCGGDTSPAEEPDAGVAGTFSEIYDTFFPLRTNARCDFCHGMPASQVSNGFLSMGMDKDSAYAALVDKTSSSADCNGKKLVVPFHPEQSLLLDKLSSKPSCASRMPLGGMALTEAQLELVRSWIAAGAKND
jgi:hypothetical protein